MGVDCDKICSECGTPFKGKPGSKYCSEMCRDKNTYVQRMLKPEWRISKLLNMARNRSKTKGLDFDLTQEHLESLWKENDGCCSVTGIPFELGRSEKGKVHPYAPSLDRIVPLKGYTQGNVRLVCYQMNVAMSEFGLEQFEELIEQYINFNGGVKFA